MIRFYCLKKDNRHYFFKRSLILPGSFNSSKVINVLDVLQLSKSKIYLTFNNYFSGTNRHYFSSI
jgi:hypothetical protein